jgi:hypothetical protein
MLSVAGGVTAHVGDGLSSERGVLHLAGVDASGSSNVCTSGWTVIENGGDLEPAGRDRAAAATLDRTLLAGTGTKPDARRSASAALEALELRARRVPEEPLGESFYTLVPEHAALGEHARELSLAAG